MSGSLMNQKMLNGPAPSTVAAVHEVVRDVQKRRVDEHHRDADELPDRNERDGDEGRSLLPEEGREIAPEPHRAHDGLGDAPEGVEHQLPDEADDDDGQHRRQKQERPVDAAAGKMGKAQQHGEPEPDAFCTTMWIRKNATLLRSAFQNWLDHRGSASSRRKFSSPTKDRTPDSSPA